MANEVTWSWSVESDSRRMSLVMGLPLAALQGVGGQKKVFPQIRDSARMAVEGNEAVTCCGYFSRCYDKVPDRNHT